MVVDGCTFLRRAQIFLRELKACTYPNSSSLAKLCACSKNTAQRTIYRLRDEYFLPLRYDPSAKGYALTDQSYTLPAVLPPGKDELIALLLARDMIKNIDADDIRANLDNLWGQFAAANPCAGRELEAYAKVFSCDTTIVGDLADRGLLTFVFFAKAGESLRITYKSPWRHTQDKVYEGRVLRVHFSDGNLYLLFAEKSGREMILNASFIKEFKVLDYSVSIARHEPGNVVGSEHWLEGFGIWAGETPEMIEVKIAPPAAEYYAAQRWHGDQEDVWEEGVLVRRFPGICAPEVVRRVLSLGGHVRDIKPFKLKEMVRQEAKKLCEALSH